MLERGKASTFHPFAISNFDATEGELEALESLLDSAEKHLAPGGTTQPLPLFVLFSFLTFFFRWIKIHLLLCSDLLFLDSWYRELGESNFGLGLARIQRGACAATGASLTFGSSKLSGGTGKRLLLKFGFVMLCVWVTMKTGLTRVGLNKVVELSSQNDAPQEGGRGILHVCLKMGRLSNVQHHNSLRGAWAGTCPIVVCFFSRSLGHHHLPLFRG